MTFTDSTFIQAAFKKLFGLAHTEVKTFPLGNEANPSQITIMSSDVYAEAIPSTAQAIANRIIACTNATNGQTDSYLTVAQNLTLAPDGSGEGHPYLVTVPAGHGLIGQINPLTGVAYAQGDIVMSIIPKKFGSTWRPVLYNSSKTEIPPLSSLDWIIDERGFVVIRDNSTAPAYLGCWVYVGNTLTTWAGSTNITTLGTIGTGTWQGGVIAGLYGGTGVANSSKTITLGGNFATSGAYASTLTLTGTTNITLPTTGTLATLSGTEELDGKTLDTSVGKGTWTASGTWTLPALTLGGTVSGGGQQLNNIIIGTVTPLAGTFTTIGISMAPSDHSGSGVITVGTVGETVAMGDVLYLKSDGKFWKADADTSTTMPVMVMAMAAITADNTGNLLHIGYFRDDTWTLTVGGFLYASTTGGNPTQTAPTGTGDQVQIVGTAVTSHIIFFNPSPVIVEIA